MPLVNPSPQAPPNPRPQVQQIAAPTYKGVTVDTKLEPIDNLLSHIEGSSWTVNYYSQILDLDSPTMGQGLSTNPIHQQYKLIRGMEIKVSSPLSSSQNDETKHLDVKGSATLYPFIIPNEGDMFIADMGAGREGVFQVISSDRKSVFKQSVHEITYNLTAYSEDRLADLNSKVVQTFVYDKEFIQYGQNPLLFEEDHQILQYLRRNYKTIFNNYIRLFRSREFNTLILPGQDSVVTDTYLTKMVMSCFDVWDCDDLRYVKQLNIEEDQALRAIQILEVITKRDYSMLADCFTQYGTVSASLFSNDPMMEGIYYSGVNNVVYPVDPVLNVDFNLITPEKLVDLNPLIPAFPKLKSIYDLLPPSARKILGDYIADSIDGFTSFDSDGNPIIYPTISPIIHRAGADGYYIFSQAFYLNIQISGAQSQLELAVRDYLLQNAPDIARLKRFCEDMSNWNTLDRFYYTPIVLLLIKAAIRSL